MSSYAVYFYLAPISFALVLSVCVVAWRRRGVAGARGLLGLGIATLLWTLLDWSHMVVPSVEVSLVIRRLVYLVVPWMAPFWIAFALGFTGRSPLRSRLLRVFVGIAVVTTIMGLTMTHHRLIWTGYAMSHADGLRNVMPEIGVWTWIHLVVSWIGVVYGLVLITVAYAQSLSTYRRLSVWLVIGGLLPTLYNVAEVLGLLAVDKDFSTVVYGTTAMAFGLGVFRFRLFDLQPTSRSVLVDRMTEALVVVDVEGRVMDFNQSFAASVASSVTLGEPLADAVPGLSGALREAQSEMHVGSQVPGESGRWFEWRASPIDASRDLGRVILLHDVTERRAADAALRDALAELEARNDDLDAFARMTAHDLKNPINGIRGYAQLMQLEGDDLTADLRDEAVDTILETSDQMTRIIDDLLLLSSVRAATVPLVPLDMSDLTSHVLRQLAPAIAQSDAAIGVPHEWPVALGHAPWVTICWTNYLSNALKYGGDSPDVQLGAEQIGDRVRCWVDDCGPGVPHDQRAEVFAPFKRLHGAETEGHGVGLSIVQRIVDRLGGACGVDDAPGGGARFWFELPAA